MRAKRRHTLGETGAQETRDLLDQGIGSDEGIVLACKLLDELLVLVQLLQVVGAHGVDTTVLGTINIMLVTENAIIISQNSSTLFVCIRRRTRCSFQGGERQEGGQFQRNACHAEDHSS